MVPYVLSEGFAPGSSLRSGGKAGFIKVKPSRLKMKTDFTQQQSYQYDLSGQQVENENNKVLA